MNLILSYLNSVLLFFLEIASVYSTVHICHDGWSSSSTDEDTMQINKSYGHRGRSRRKLCRWRCLHVSKSWKLFFVRLIEVGKFTSLLRVALVKLSLFFATLLAVDFVLT